MHSTPILGVTPHQIMIDLEVSFRDIVGPLALAEDLTDTGGWFTCWTKGPRADDVIAPLFGYAIGDVFGRDAKGRHKMVLFQDVANTKVRCILDNDVETSWLTRDPSNGKYGGGIRLQFGRIIFAFSGLAEWADEMLMLIVAWHLRIIDPPAIERIITISNNTRARTYFINQGVLAA